MKAFKLLTLLASATMFAAIGFAGPCIQGTLASSLTFGVGTTAVPGSLTEARFSYQISGGTVTAASSWHIRLGRGEQLHRDCG
jgi:hypothetical protein